MGKSDSLLLPDFVQQAPLTRRQTLALLAVTGAGVAGAAWQLLTPKKNEFEKMVAAFPKQIHGARSVNVAEIPGAVQCIIFITYYHNLDLLEEEGNVVLPEEVRSSIQRSSEDVARIVYDVQKHPQYKAKKALWESIGTQSTSMQTLLRSERLRSLPDTHSFKPTLPEDIDGMERNHRVFHNTFGGVGPLILNGALEVHGCEDPELNRKAHELYRSIHLHGARDEETMSAYRRAQYKREWQTFESASLHDDQFVFLLIGHDHLATLPSTLHNWNRANPKKTKALVIIQPNEVPVLPTSQTLQ